MTAHAQSNLGVSSKLLADTLISSRAELAVIKQHASGRAFGSAAVSRPEMPSCEQLFMCGDGDRIVMAADVKTFARVRCLYA